MHTVIINNATYNTGHLHISSLAYRKHRHHYNCNMNFRLSLVGASMIFVYQMKIIFFKKTYAEKEGSTLLSLGNRCIKDAR